MAVALGSAAKYPAACCGDFYSNAMVYRPAPYRISWVVAAKTAKDLQVEVARLEPWQVISRSQDRAEGFVKFAAEAFYRSHG